MWGAPSARLVGLMCLDASRQPGGVHAWQVHWTRTAGTLCSAVHEDRAVRVVNEPMGGGPQEQAPHGSDAARADDDQLSVARGADKFASRRAVRQPEPHEHLRVVLRHVGLDLLQQVATGSLSRRGELLVADGAATFPLEWRCPCMKKHELGIPAPCLPGGSQSSRSRLRRLVDTGNHGPDGR